MNDLPGSTLPKFSSNDSDNLKLGVDFIGINHYTSFYVGDCCIPPANPHLEVPGQKVSLDKPTLKMASPLENLQDTYCVGEGGGRYRFADLDLIEFQVTVRLPTLTPLLMNPLNDVKRVEYLRDYLDYLSRAMRKGADVRGYFVWTLLDAYEWLHGFTKRFGPRHVDHTTLKVETHS
ncbi:beta-glucosidase 46-like [Coffea arabica]|uniref:Beta-glucosidase 46-like n=1 Tax=Coffea arabica TaxID=13443 RepID=A0A6P6UAT7_COFAR|nr:beta-glucosidase 46-like [Coffea arabica]XP_027089561.1 beta-glucosidase 46-like [Coffea arabica]